MEELKAGGYISKLHFNNGKEVDINEDDIVVFVGPNNAGKSQSLKDIYTLTERQCSNNTVVINEVNLVKNDTSLIDLLRRIATPIKRNDYDIYDILGVNIVVGPNMMEIFCNNLGYGDFRTLLIANLNTAARLSICEPPPLTQRSSARQHPIHYAAFDPGYRKWLSKNFKKAFGIEITPNTQFGSTVPLCIGEPVHLDGEYEDEQDRQEAYAKILATYKQVQDQGDGIKSFTGILLYLMLDYFRTYLLDEPEAFLHPPQAKIMGQIIGETLTHHQQAFISTHSEEIIKGLLDVCPERIKIIRITRKDDVNEFSILDNENFSKVWNDPLLKYSNIMASLFHKTVVLCESDSDCKMYSIIENHLKQKEGKYSETMFIHCGGKQRMAQIAAALGSLNIDVKLIPDLDVINNENTFKGIAEAFGIDWSTIQSDYNLIVSNLHSPRETIDRNQAKSVINSILEGSNNRTLSNNEITQIRDEITTISKWKQLKISGEASLPRGDANRAYRNIKQVLNEHGIYPVPVGELECFIKEIGGHGPSWVNTVLETYPDLNDEIYEPIQDFIRSLNL